MHTMIKTKQCQHKKGVLFMMGERGKEEGHRS